MSQRDKYCCFYGAYIPLECEAGIWGHLAIPEEARIAGISKRLTEDQVSETMGMEQHRLFVCHCKEKALTPNEVRNIGCFEQRTYNI